MGNNGHYPMLGLQRPDPEGHQNQCEGFDIPVLGMRFPECCTTPQAEKSHMLTWSVVLTRSRAGPWLVSPTPQENLPCPLPVWDPHHITDEAKHFLSPETYCSFETSLPGH